MTTRRSFLSGVVTALAAGFSGAFKLLGWASPPATPQALGDLIKPEVFAKYDRPWSVVVPSRLLEYARHELRGTGIEVIEQRELDVADRKPSC